MVGQDAIYDEECLESVEKQLEEGTVPLMQQNDTGILNNQIRIDEVKGAVFKAKACRAKGWMIFLQRC